QAALWPQAGARHAAAALRSGSATRQDRGETEDRPGRAAPGHRRQTQYAHRELAEVRHHRPRRMHPQGGGELGLEKQIQATSDLKPPCGPKRGHGTPQPRFGQEVQLDKIAEKLKIDPAELRLGIVAKPNTLTANWLKLGTIGLAECIRKVVASSDWKNKFKQLPISSRPVAPSGGTARRSRASVRKCNSTRSRRN